MDAHIFTFGMTIISIVLSNLIALITNMGKPYELKDTLKRLKLERLEKNAKSQVSFGNHVIRQVDVNTQDRNWRGSEQDEADYAYEFSRINIESALFIAKIEKLKSRTSVLLFLSLLLPFIAVTNVIVAVIMNEPEIAKWVSAITAALSLAYIIIYFIHSTTISNMDQR